MGGPLWVEMDANMVFTGYARKPGSRAVGAHQYRGLTRPQQPDISAGEVRTL